MAIIRMIVDEFEEGRIYEGKVVSIKDFGAFIEFTPVRAEWCIFPRLPITA